jgi:hypothetical protein
VKRRNNSTELRIIYTNKGEGDILILIHRNDLAWQKTTLNNGELVMEYLTK